MTERTIFLKKRPIRKEAIAGGAITPGHLIALNSAGKVVVHAVAGGIAAKAFAFENELTNYGGAGTTDHTIDTPYANNDNCYYGVCSSGAEVYALIAAGNPAIAKGAYLQSAGDGTLEAVGAGTPGTTFPGVAVAVALEAVDNSGGASPARIIVEIL